MLKLFIWTDPWGGAYGNTVRAVAMAADVEQAKKMVILALEKNYENSPVEPEEIEMMNLGPPDCIVTQGGVLFDIEFETNVLSLDENKAIILGREEDE